MAEYLIKSSTNLLALFVCWNPPSPPQSEHIESSRFSRHRSNCTPSQSVFKSVSAMLPKLGSSFQLMQHVVISPS
jgi:hypothetical protein